MIERYIEKQKEFCELYKINFNEVERLNSKLISLFENGLRRTALIAIRDAYSDVNQNMNYWLSIWHLSNDKKTKPKP